MNKIAKKVKEHYDDLDHFLCHGAWPLALNKSRRDLAKLSAAFIIDESFNRLCFDNNIELSDKLLLEFWKLKAEELDSWYNESLDKMDKIRKMLGD